MNFQVSALGNAKWIFCIFFRIEAPVLIGRGLNTPRSCVSAIHIVHEFAPKAAIRFCSSLSAIQAAKKTHCNHILPL
jgi:hypothetical protein